MHTLNSNSRNSCTAKICYGIVIQRHQTHDDKHGNKVLLHEELAMKVITRYSKNIFFIFLLYLMIAFMQAFHAITPCCHIFQLRQHNMISNLSERLPGVMHG